MKQTNQIGLCIICAVLALLLIAFFLILPPAVGEIPKFTDEDGNILPDSIAEKTWIEIDGAKIGMIITGENVNKPVLLVCGGGPGIPEYLLESMNKSVLTKHFVVAFFDYRGTGLSYSEVNPDEMTTERYLADVDEVTNYLLKRFNKERIYLAGHSFGSYIALNAAKNHPEKYEAYLAISQATHQKESEYIAYDYMLEEYKKNGNQSMVEELEKYPIKTSEEAFDSYKKKTRDNAMHGLGVGTTRKMRSVIFELFFPSLRNTAYTIGERLDIWKGKGASNNFAVTKDAHNFDAFEEIKSLDIPIYFFAGKYDYTCCESLQKKYYDEIEAPKKEYFLYENSAHSPVFEEDERTDEILKGILME